VAADSLTTLFEPRSGWFASGVERGPVTHVARAR
jgi:hypothetical protein